MSNSTNTDFFDSTDSLIFNTGIKVNENNVFSITDYDYAINVILKLVDCDKPASELQLSRIVERIASMLKLFNIASYIFVMKNPTDDYPDDVNTFYWVESKEKFKRNIYLKFNKTASDYSLLLFGKFIDEMLMRYYDVTISFVKISDDIRHQPHFDFSSRDKGWIKDSLQIVIVSLFYIFDKQNDYTQFFNKKRCETMIDDITRLFILYRAIDNDDYSDKTKLLTFLPLIWHEKITRLIYPSWPLNNTLSLVPHYSGNKNPMIEEEYIKCCNKEWNPENAYISSIFGKYGSKETNEVFYCYNYYKVFNFPDERKPVPGIVFFFDKWKTEYAHKYHNEECHRLIKDYKKEK